MNQFYNPHFIAQILKSYFFDINRLWKLVDVELRRYQDKRLQQMARYADTVPLYHDVYKKAGIKPHDISGIHDLPKLPIVTKEDFKKYYPDGIISSKTKKSQLIEVATSGTTGKSLALYVDMYDIMMGLFGYIRAIRAYDILWWKTRMTIIGDFAPHTAESGYITRGLSPRLNFSKVLRNMQWLDTNADPRAVIEAMDRFQPTFIGGYVGMLGHLALLKEQGYGKNIHPRIIAATGAVLDPSLKKFIENQFDAQVFEVYGTTETGIIGFECHYGKYHIMSDLVNLEFLKDGQSVSSGKPGNLIVTKLFGHGTPIIRYDAISDIVAPLDGSCDCGLSGGLIKRIYGRDVLSLVLPGGRVLLPSAIAAVFSRILYEIKTTKIKDTRIIQHSLTDIEVQVVIDEHLRAQEPPVEKLFSCIQQFFQEKIGPGVTIHITEVSELRKHEQRIVSHVDRSKITVTEYL